MAKTKPISVESNALPVKLMRLIREALWGLIVVSALYLALILITYHRSDPGWSVLSSGQDIANAGGRIGAYLSDLLLYLYGFSAAWFVFGLLLMARRAYYFMAESREVQLGIKESYEHKHWFWASLIGFVFVLFSSSAIEAMRFAGRSFSLPLNPTGPGTCSGAGGIIGCELADVLSGALGISGALMLLLLFFAAGLSLTTGISWIKLSEWLGGKVEDTVVGSIQALKTWQDRRVGRRAEVAREATVVQARRQLKEQEPLIIASPVVQIPQSARAVKEKQVSLFQDMPDSDLPPLSLLDMAETSAEMISQETLEFTSRLIERKLADFNVEVRVLAAYPGPVITRYEIEPAVGVKGSQIVNLIKDLGRALSVGNIRVVETIPGKSYMGLEIPNPKRETVRLSEIVGSQAYGDMPSPLALAMGKDIAGNPVVVDLAKMPHLLVAGTTGSGKSVAINAMILSLLYKATPQQIRLILVDPKMLELSVYDGIPHLLAPVVVDMKEAAHALQWCVAEMDKRYKLMSALGVRNLAGYNTKIEEAENAGESIPHPFSLTPDEPEPLIALPNIVVVIDELADLMMVVGKKVEELIARIAQKARAAGIHLVVATQRPSVDVITGLIKANIPTRVSFQVSSRVDSRTILDQMGAESLLGQGDMLYLPTGAGYPQRVHGAYVADHEVHRVVDFLKKQGEPDYIEGLLTGEASLNDTEGSSGNASVDSSAEKDPLYDQAVAIVIETRRASISLVQRHLRIGYNRAARLIEEMEKAGLVSTMATNGNREVLVPGREQ
ncbi:MAG: DNA translocase FtsK [Ferrovum sp. 37-45-19]|uniref:DNA translocase FtsK n=1 Tax=Ferrovum sp. JA12 TaxID=1356299 RepID=UPI000703914E|nr:DNA translocase FtsK [Ferrovum sp. JA12]OYV79521.1 MAG: DNA translocase FtsK [Ferrovum sp. 21-44-67]OYV94264.1 MAG: DNA translocase FtsK [Ferrovum sp. 37-45-19]OZB31768.1 MAG: DNA translocase FtsK [Ferrovum sp. 34-44-207]HQT81673.1 DNA translocase FtsK 4TM domain-containing protein [Ferrovaceae bacterium]KRH78388.1 DNA translocase FtsK [Ferrovum sp. JA12]